MAGSELVHGTVKFPAGFTSAGAPLWDDDAVFAHIKAIKEANPDPRKAGEALSEWALHSHIRRQLVGLSNSVCRHCWLLGRHCVCASLPTPITVPFADAATGQCSILRNRMKVTLVMHPKEFFRASNTGRFIHHILPHDTRVVVWEPTALNNLNALWCVMDELRDCPTEPVPLRHVHDFTVWSTSGEFGQEVPVLLFPSKTSVPARDFGREFRAACSSSSSSTAPASGAGAGAHTPTSSQNLLHLLVVDGTWQQAKRMCAKIATKMPCINIDVADHTATLYTALRKESVEGRTSTLEAIATALHDLGESHIITSRLLQCVRVLTDGMLTQSGREFKSKSPHCLRLPPGCGAFAALSDALTLHIVSYLGSFPDSHSPASPLAAAAPSAPADVDTAAAASKKRGRDDGDEDSGEDAQGSTVAARFFARNWRGSPSRFNLPREALAFALSCHYMHIMLAKHAVGLAQQWR